MVPFYPAHGGTTPPLLWTSPLSPFAVILRMTSDLGGMLRPVPSPPRAIFHLVWRVPSQDCVIATSSRHGSVSGHSVRFDRRSPGSIPADAAYTVCSARARHSTTPAAPPSVICLPPRCFGSTPGYPRSADGRHRASWSMPVPTR